MLPTCRHENHNVLALLTACCVARLDGSDVPALLPAETERTPVRETTFNGKPV